MNSYVTMVKLNSIYLEQDKIFAFTSVVREIKDDNLRLSKYVKITYNKVKVKGNKFK